MAAENSSPVVVVVVVVAVVVAAGALVEELVAMAAEVEGKVGVATAAEVVAVAAAAIAAVVRTAVLEGNHCSHSVSCYRKGHQRIQLPKTLAPHPLPEGLVGSSKGCYSLEGLAQRTVAVALEVLRMVACHILKVDYLEEHCSSMEEVLLLKAHRTLVAPDFVSVLAAPVEIVVVAEVGNLDCRRDVLKP